MTCLGHRCSVVNKITDKNICLRFLVIMPHLVPYIAMKFDTNWLITLGNSWKETTVKIKTQTSSFYRNDVTTLQIYFYCMVVLCCHNSDKCVSSFFYHVITEI